MISDITRQRVARAGRGTHAPVRRRVGLAAVALLVSAPGHAYIDPGTGSILLQGLLAGIAVALGVARAYWQRIKAFFARADRGTDIAERDHDSAPRKDSDAKSQP